MEKTKWKRIGEIGVDAGLCWIGDPCYIMTMPHSKEEEFQDPETKEQLKDMWQPKPYPKDLGETWGDFCDKFTTIETTTENIGNEKVSIPHQTNLTHRQFNYDLGHPGLGVCVQTGYGDGSYPVYAKFDSDGRLVEVKVKFD